MSRVAFGPYVLDRDTRELLHSGRRVPLSPKAFDLLSVLVEHRPTVLAKATLHQRLWQSTFVTDATLASVVKELRRALGDTAREPQFIRTAHGFGYGFSGSAHDLSRTNQPIVNWVVLSGVETPLADGDHIIGRERTATIPLSSPTVSRRHARIVVNGTLALLEDLGSKNGTYLQNTRIQTPVQLTDGDRIRVGSFELVFRAICESASTTTGKRSSAL